MKVSVIMNTVKDDREQLSEAINSYLSQVDCEVELIISTIENDDNLNYILRHFPRCKVVTMPEHKDGKTPKGSFIQLNNAIPHITGDYFCFASGNDIACNNKISLELKKLKETGSEVCYSAYDLVNRQGRKIQTQLFYEYDFKKHLKGNFVSDCALISKRLVDKYLPFDVSLNNYAYWDLWLRIYEGEGDVFCYNPIPTWDYRQNSDSMHLLRQRDKKKLAQGHIDRQKMLSLHT